MYANRVKKKPGTTLSCLAIILAFLVGTTPAFAGENHPKPAVETLNSETAETTLVKLPAAEIITESDSLKTKLLTHTYTDSGTTQVGTLPDNNPATAQLVIGPVTGTVSICSGVWVTPQRLLSAKHCFTKFNPATDKIRIYDSNSAAGAPPVAIGQTWAAPTSGDLAVVMLPWTNHAVAPINASPIAGNTPLLVCGQNYLINNSNSLTVNSHVDSGKGNFCGSVATLTDTQSQHWQLDVRQTGTLATVPMLVEHGDSGGPLYTTSGQLVGITSSKSRAAYTNGETLLFNASVALSNHVSWLVSMGIPVPGSGMLIHKELPRNLIRISGRDRIDTSEKVFSAMPETQTLVITTGLIPADGLAATQLAGVDAAALLLSNSRQQLDSPALNALNKHGLKRVVRVGGTVGLSAADKQLIASKGLELVELIGDNRFSTAVKVAQYRDKLDKKPAQVLLADGISFPDALAAGAAAAALKASLVLSSGETLPAETLEYLKSSGSEIVTVGGPAQHAVSANGMKIVRSYTGKDRYDTALMLASGLPASTGVVLVSGRNFPDALSAGAYTIKQNSRLLLIPPAGYKSGFLSGLWSKCDYGVIVGGKGAVSDQDIAWALVP